jgi:serine/threonine protein kinase
MSFNTQADSNNIEIIGKVAHGKFPIFLAKSKDAKSFYAVKIFPYSHKNFLNESRFLGLSNPNVLPPLVCSPISCPPDPKMSGAQSYILMDYAINGDLFSLIFEKKIKLEETLIRTYFKQLMLGLEYLHKTGIAHMDLKLDNLALDKDFQLRIIDFDISYIQGDQNVQCIGTQCYRPPEIVRKHCQDPFSVDIYSAGIILFIMMSGKNFPYVEDMNMNNLNLFELMQEQHELFWQAHEKLDEQVQNWDSDLKQLFLGMVRANPEQRLKLNDVLENKWFTGQVYSREELTTVMEGLSKK